MASTAKTMPGPVQRWGPGAGDTEGGVCKRDPVESELAFLHALQPGQSPVQTAHQGLVDCTTKDKHSTDKIQRFVQSS